MIKNINIILCSLLIAPLSISTMNISQLPTDLNWPILEQLLQKTEIRDVAQTIKKIALISKKNNEFLNRPDTIEKIVNLLYPRTKNKTRAAELIQTKAAKEWLDSYKQKEEGKKDFAQAREDENSLFELFGNRDTPIERIKSFINQGVNVNYSEKWGVYSILTTAISIGLLERVKLLLSIPGIDVNKQNVNGNTALITSATFSSYKGDYEVLKLLLAAPGINPNVVNRKGETTLDMVSNTEGKYTAAVIDILKKAGAKTAQELKK